MRPQYMKAFRTTLVSLMFIFVSPTSLAEEPISKAEKCEQFGAYQDKDGVWQTCETSESTPEESEY